MGKWWRRFSRLSIPTWAIIAIILSAAYIVGLIFDVPTWIRGSNWVWERRGVTWTWWRWLLLVLLFLIGSGFFFLAQYGEQWRRRQTAVFLGGLVIFTVGVQLAVAAQHRSQPLAVGFWASPGFFLDGVRISEPTEFLQDHLEMMPHYRDTHVRTQPPGWPLTFWAVSQAAARFPAVSEPAGHWFRRYDCLAYDLQDLTLTQVAAAVLPMSLLFISGLGVLPLYGLGRRLFSVKVARVATAVYPFLPAFIVFQARFDTFYAVMMLVALWLTAELMTQARWLWAAVLLGLLLGLSPFWGFGTLAIAAIVNLFLFTYFALHFIIPDEVSSINKHHYIIRWLTVNAAIGVVLLLLWGALWLKWDVNGIAMFRQSQSLHHELRINYPLWPLFNLYDLAVFMGIPLAVGGVIALLRTLHHRSMPVRPMTFVLAWFLAVALLNLSGQIRAETGRLWLFLFAPGVLVGTAGWLRGQDGDEPAKRPSLWRYGLFAAYMIQALVMGCILGGRIPPVSVPEPVWRLAETAVALEYQLGDNIKLIGYELEPMGDDIHLTLYWQAISRPTDDYSVFVHLLGDDGVVLAQADGPPQNGRLPTWCWVPGEIVADARILTAKDEEKIAAKIGVGLYDWQTGSRLSVSPTATHEIILLPILIPNTRENEHQE